MTIRQHLDKLFARIEFFRKRRQYQNLVFKGGGVRGIAYLGVLDVLDEINLIPNIRRAAGSSAGAIAALLLSFRLSAQETKDLFLTLDFRKMPEVIPGEESLPFWRLAQEFGMRRFFQNYGYHSSGYFYDWAQTVIAGQCDGNRRASFREFRERGFRDLYIVASNVSRHRAEVFSHETTPDVAVADAVRMSVSIPIFFEALRFDGQSFGQGDYYLDGGIYNNYPMNIFDHARYASRRFAFRSGVNWETLGLFLYPEDDTDNDPDLPTNVWEFASMALRNLDHAYELSSIETNYANKYRTIAISDKGISTTDFDIDPDDEKFQLLYQSGVDATRKFFGLEQGSGGESSQ